MKRGIFILTCLLVAVLVACWAEPYADQNSDLILFVTTVFTVFAGFLVAIITIIGDPSLVPGGSWRLVEHRRDSIEQRIVWHIYLFLCYLVTIAFIFVSVIFEKVPKEIISESVKAWIARGYLFFGVFSFLLSFALPFALHRVKMSRLDQETERRRQSEGIDRPD
jgi:hypothetical protein